MYTYCKTNKHTDLLIRCSRAPFEGYMEMSLFFPLNLFLSFMSFSFHKEFLEQNLHLKSLQIVRKKNSTIIKRQKSGNVKSKLF